MLDDEAIAALEAAHLRGFGSAHRIVGHAIAKPCDAAVGGRENIHPGALRGHGRQAQINAVVAIAGERAALIIHRGGRGIDIDIFLDEAGAAHFARDRQLQNRRLLRQGVSR
jgi:hypothetical protein